MVVEVLLVLTKGGHAFAHVLAWALVELFLYQLLLYHGCLHGCLGAWKTHGGQMVEARVCRLSQSGAVPRAGSWYAQCPTFASGACAGLHRGVFALLSGWLRQCNGGGVIGMQMGTHTVSP